MHPRRTVDLLDSVHGEVTSIRARLRNGRIYYRVEDECANDFGYTIVTSPRSSKLPLALSQLITLINTAQWEGMSGLVVPHWHTVFGKQYDVASAASFVRVQSYFYPTLAQWYGAHLKPYVEQLKALRAATKTDDRDRSPLLANKT